MKKLPMDPTLRAYRRALSAAVVAHARYLAVRDDKSVTPHLVERRRQEWQVDEYRKMKLQHRVTAAPQPGRPDMPAIERGRYGRQQ